MGYSIAFPPKSKKAQAEIVQFLRKNLRPWCEVAKGTPLAIEQDYDATRFVHEGAELAYDSGQKVGFNYSVSYLINGYMWGVLSWAALRVGRKRPFKTEYEIAVPVPYIVYDGHEAIPVLLRSEWEGKANDHASYCLVDGDGFRPARRHWKSWEKLGYNLLSFILGQEADLGLQDVLVKRELQRLSGIWETDHRRRG